MKAIFLIISVIFSIRSALAEQFINCFDGEYSVEIFVDQHVDGNKIKSIFSIYKRGELIQNGNFVKRYEGANGYGGYDWEFSPGCMEWIGVTTNEFISPMNGTWSGSGEISFDNVALTNLQCKIIVD